LPLSPGRPLARGRDTRRSGGRGKGNRPRPGHGQVEGGCLFR